MVSCLNTSNATWVGADQFNITDQCALFDFSVYTIIVGSMTILGIVGNIISFTVLWKDSSKSATAFLLRSLAVADSLVLMVAVPLYAIAPIYPYTNFLKSFYDMYPNLIPYLWACFQIPYTGTILLTVLVSLNRYFAVCKPFKSAKMCSTIQAKRHVIYVALFSIVYNVMIALSCL